MATPAGILTRGFRRALPIAGGAAVLTLLFSAQEIVRNVAGGGPAFIARALTFNAIDWGIWGLLAPVIVATTRRFRLDGDTPLLARVSVWISVAAFCVLAQSVSAGWLIFTFHLVPIPVLGAGASPPLIALLARWVVSTAGLNVLVFIMIVGLLHAALYYSDLRARRLREIDLEARLAQAELKVLRMQLQPHFLFNALHTVSSLMLTDIASAHRVIAAIGDLLRWSIDHTASQEVSLRRELEFADRYLEVQQARFRSRLRVERHVEPDCLDALVPSLVLQPLLENAVRHGIEPSADGATIRVSASKVGDALVLDVRDNAPEGQRQNVDFAGNGGAPGGVGLSNIRSRLAHLYGDRQKFQAGPSSAHWFVVSLSIPFHSDARLYPAPPKGA